MALDQPDAVDGGARGGEARGITQRRGYRQPERQNRGERRASGYDEGKKIKARKRHIITDTQIILVGAVVHTVEVQDPDSAPDVLAGIRHRVPSLCHVFADGGYAGDKLRKALTKIGKWTLEIINRSDRARL